MEKSENENSVVIFLGNSNKVEIVMFMEIEEIIIFIFDQRPGWLQNYLRVY